MATIAARWFGLSGIAAIAIAAGMLHAATTPVPHDPDFDVAGKEISTADDGHDRMTVGVRIDGRGPFAFVVDTGAERTVISTELAGQLQLAPKPASRLFSLTELSTVPTVLITKLSVSDAVIDEINAPALARDHLGAAGILGLDTLQAQRIVFDFKRGILTVSPSSEREEKRMSDEILVLAKNRFGRLVLADAAADGQKIRVIIDTGAQLSVGNRALLRKLIARRRLQAPNTVELRSVTGGSLRADFATLRDVRIGGVHVQNMPVAISDSGVFSKLGLDDRPALLLGMDVLRSFDRVSIDFANRRVRFRMPDGAPRNQMRRA